MLLVLLILFTKVLADSEEDKYIDLLPDEEKQQFLEKVARRLLLDVESQENIKDVQSGDLSDEHMKQHTEYVKAVLKEEQENLRRKKGDDLTDTEENLGVKPLETETLSLSDLTIREERADIASDNKNNITIEMVTDNSLIIKRSVQEDNAKKSYESDETASETLYRVTNNDVTSGKSNEVEVTNEKRENDNVAAEAQGLSSKSSKINESIAIGKENDESESVVSNQKVSSENGTLNVSVKVINKPLRRSHNNESILVGSTTEDDSATSTAVFVNSTVNKSDEYNNASTVNEEFTTATYPIESSSIIDVTTDSTISDSTLSLTKLMSNKNENSDPVQKSTNHTVKDTGNVIGITIKSTRTSTNTDEETTKSVPLMDFVPETIELALAKRNGSFPYLTTEAMTESTTVLWNTENSGTPVIMTKDTQVLVEHSTSVPTILTSVQPATLKPNKITKKKEKPGSKQHTLSKELTTMGLESNDESTEATTQKISKHKVVIYKPQKYILGPKAKKMAQAEQDVIQNNHFIDLEKHYYDSNYNVRKEYHVFEITPHNSPFIKAEEPIVDQPYYVPIYNYSPNNAYFNPKNRLGPNAEDSSEANNSIFNDDDAIGQFHETKTLDFKVEYDTTFNNKRKAFGGKKTRSHSIHRAPRQNNINSLKPKIIPEDYFDSDYYYGRVRSNFARKINGDDLAIFPNSDETDHPAHSIQEGSLKDHVRAVRNILFHQKSFGLLDKDKYGGDVVNVVRMGRLRNGAKQVLRAGLDEEPDNKYTNIAIDYDSDRETPAINSGTKQDETNTNHIQKVGYLKKKNDVKELYVMDDIFKANVEKYIKENNPTPATQLPFQVTTNHLNEEDEVRAYIRNKEGNNEAGNDTETSSVKRYKSNNEELTIVTQNSNEKNTTETTQNVKLNLRRNDDIKVSVYLQVLKDMIILDDKALVQYDWLGTTVNVQAALQKLYELNALVANEEDIHPADEEILKYLLFLHKLATEIFEANDFGAQLKKKLVLPRNKKLRHRLINDKGLINKVWLYLRKEVPQVNEHGALKHFNKFLISIEDGLYDLHVAIKNIAKITKYKNQHWYQNLKDLYINTDEKHLLELILHMTCSRLFSLIEESAKNGLEDDYIQYMKKNKTHSKKTLEEMMFVMEILEEYNKFVE